jgi:hypothetical protein
MRGMLSGPFFKFRRWRAASNSVAVKRSLARNGPPPLPPARAAVKRHSSSFSCDLATSEHSLRVATGRVRAKGFRFRCCNLASRICGVYLTKYAKLRLRRGGLQDYGHLEAFANHEGAAGRKTQHAARPQPVLSEGDPRADRARTRRPDPHGHFGDPVRADDVGGCRSTAADADSDEHRLGGRR